MIIPTTHDATVDIENRCWLRRTLELFAAACAISAALAGAAPAKQAVPCQREQEAVLQALEVWQQGLTKGVYDQAVAIKLQEASMRLHICTSRAAVAGG